MFARLFRRRSPASQAAALYARIVERSRAPAFYAEYRVPDSFDGRFEMLALHAFLVLHRLKASDAAAMRALAQDLVDVLFADIDRTFREQGAADIGVGRRVQKVAEAVYGRIAAYDQALAGEGAELALALRRNVHGTLAADDTAADAAAAALASYVRQAAAALAAGRDEVLLAGHPPFGPDPVRRD